MKTTTKITIAASIAVCLIGWFIVPTVDQSSNYVIENQSAQSWNLHDDSRNWNNGIAVDDGDNIFLPGSRNTLIVDDYLNPTYVLTDCEVFGTRRICDRIAIKI